MTTPKKSTSLLNYFKILQPKDIVELNEGYVITYCYIILFN